MFARGESSMLTRSSVYVSLGVMVMAVVMCRSEPCEESERKAREKERRENGGREGSRGFDQCRDCGKCLSCCW